MLNPRACRMMWFAWLVATVSWRLSWFAWRMSWA
jgi:hypothetical protein